ncbi:MAG: hypothetical protein PUC88_04650 [Clostridia bacterium]|nr:hypothetical protein [Clostridia bacterium]
MLKKLPKALPGKEMKSAIRRFAAGVFAAVILYSSISVCKNISDKQNFPNEHDFVKDKNTVSTKPKNNSIVDTQSELSAIEESSSYVIEDEKPPVSDNPNDESITSQTETTPPPTLEEYLSGLTCEGCPRRYSLLTPRCTRGQAKAEQAEEEYYQIYAENGITG